MAMREKFTKPGESIHYYLVEWDPAALSWEDFRGKLLGATDPATGAITSFPLIISVRNSISTAKPWQQQ
mgnify:CR=1 FL=1